MSCGPQSNQRGIETKSGQVQEGFPLCLNRTSVGLKPRSTPLGRRPNEEPQSNQRGIETARWMQPLRDLQVPQSNQRGIETLLGSLLHLLAEIGLNRTSVGLKRACRSSPWPTVGDASIEPAWD